MYAENSQQAVKMRGLALQMRHDAQETADSFYRRLLENAAIDLEMEADRVECAVWRAPFRRFS